jgi:5-methylcytosine-specific restriction enzyme subunit McrC
MMIQVREYARLTTDRSVSESLDCGIVSDTTLDWLQDLAAEWKGSDPVALIDGHRSLKLGSHVGFLQSPAGEAIEILPKTRLGVEEPQEARKILQRMLLASMGIKPRVAGSASLLRKGEPLHEWIFSQFLTELQLLVRRGLRFDYERIEEESRFIRGRLQVNLQQRQLPGKQHLFHIEHDVFSANRIENRLLKSALESVRLSCKSNENWRLANELSHLLADIPAERASLQNLDKWAKNKLMQSYEPVQPWCRLILENLNPNFQQGLHKGISLLFPMEVLFEKYVEASLSGSVVVGARLKAQASSLYLVNHQPKEAEASSNMFRLKPDLMLISGLQKQVMDTKWKLLDQQASNTNDKYGISQSDLYQLFAYGHKYQNGSGHMMLIYPAHNGFTAPLPRFRFSDDLMLWVVPFCLKKQKLLDGEWRSGFTGFRSVSE